MGVEVTCDNCGDITEKKPSRVERSEHHFCSRECSDNFQSEQFAGEDNPNWQGGGEIVCIVCGDTYETTPSTADGRKYCSSECMAVDYQGRFSGEDNPSWDGGKVAVECEWCGDENEYVPARAEHRRFCSDDCYKSYLSEELRGERWAGEDNPAWSGGQERDRYYGPNWDEQRERTLERDGHECLICGSGENLHVHHKTPIRNYNRDTDRWYELANALDNLVTLCGSCHMKVHGNIEEYFYDYIG